MIDIVEYRAGWIAEFRQIAATLREVLGASALQPEGPRRAHIHVHQAGRPNQRYALLFRDFLRANRPTATAYGELKRRLASSLSKDDAYPDAKDPAVDLVYFAAEQ